MTSSRAVRILVITSQKFKYKWHCTEIQSNAGFYVYKLNKKSQIHSATVICTRRPLPLLHAH